jgi:hypothetical protein
VICVVTDATPQDANTGVRLRYVLSITVAAHWLTLVRRQGESGINIFRSKKKTDDLAIADNIPLLSP